MRSEKFLAFFGQKKKRRCSFFIFFYLIFFYCRCLVRKLKEMSSLEVRAAFDWTFLAQKISVHPKNFANKKNEKEKKRIDKSPIFFLSQQKFRSNSRIFWRFTLQFSQVFSNFSQNSPQFSLKILTNFEKFRQIFNCF